MSVDIVLGRTKDDGRVEVEAVTDAGVEFVDAYTALDLDVVDSGRILIPEEGEYALRTRAREAGLSISSDVGAP